MKIATCDSRNYVQYESAFCRMTYTQMIAYTDFVSRHWETKNDISFIRRPNSIILQARKHYVFLCQSKAIVNKRSQEFVFFFFFFFFFFFLFFFLKKKRYFIIVIASRKSELNLSRCARKPTIMVPSRYGSNRLVQCHRSRLEA